MKRSDISRGFVAFLLAALLAWQVEARTSTSVTYATNDLTTVWGAAVTPEKFEVALKRAKDWCDRNTPDGMPKLITVNSWNEWTEGSYLEPDTHFKFGYLEAVKRVFSTGVEGLIDTGSVKGQTL